EQHAAGAATVEQREEVGMLEIGRDLDLAQKTLDADDRAELGVQHLERDVARVTDVAREIHRRHATAADLAINGVAAGKRRIQLSECIHTTPLGGGERS